jgi:hypothetical protein
MPIDQLKDALTAPFDFRLQGAHGPEIKTAHVFRQRRTIFFAHARPRVRLLPNQKQTNEQMKLTERIKEAGAMGYILLWLLGVPIPILFVIFLLRGCS